MVEISAHGYLGNRRLKRHKIVIFIYLKGCEQGIGLTNTTPIIKANRWKLQGKGLQYNRRKAFLSFETLGFPCHWKS